MSLILPTSVREVFIPFKDEKELSKTPAVYLSAVDAPKGDLLITNYRVAFLTEKLGSIRLGGEDYPLLGVKVNIGYSSFISANYKIEKKIFITREILELSYETIDGIVKKAIFRLKTKGVAQSSIESMRLAAIKYREKLKARSRPPYNQFIEFIEFLGVDKSIKPLYYDSVSCCVAIGSSYFCITDIEWNIDGNPDIIGKAKSWIDEYLSKFNKKTA